MYAIKQLFHIAQPRHKVYAALSTVKGLASWWTTEASGESHLGGHLAVRFGQHAGFQMKVTQLEQDTVVSWECTDGMPAWIGTRLSFHLDDNEGKTRVRFSHDGWQQQDDFYAISTFSWARYLESLRQHCQTGVGEAFGSNNYRNS